MKRNLALYILLPLLFSLSAFGQSGVGANFGIEAKLYSGDQGAGIDDWFLGPNGLGVISEDNTAIFQARIGANA